MAHIHALGLGGEVVLVPGAPGVLELVARVGGRVVEPLLERAVAEAGVGLLLEVSTCVQCKNRLYELYNCTLQYSSLGSSSLGFSLSYSVSSMVRATGVSSS